MIKMHEIMLKIDWQYMDHKIIMHCCMIVSVLYCIVVLLDSPPSGTVANI